MRIIYGAFSQGNGHLSKASVLVPMMEARGHEVRVITSGPPPTNCYRFNWHRHFPGVAYVTRDGRTDYLASVRQWARDLPVVMRGIWSLRKIVREFQPELIVSDFEPMTTSPLIEPNCEVVAISRQVTMLDPDVPMPPGGGFERKITRSVIRVFTCGADRRYGYHYEPASFRCVPPIIRDEARQARPEMGEHVLIYCGLASFQPPPEEIVHWATRNQQRVRAYGFSNIVANNHSRLVDFPKPNPGQFLQDLVTSRGVITTAGLSTPIETFLLQKPLVVVPIPRQWEQTVNAYQLSEAGIASSVSSWDLNRILEIPPPAADHPLLDWMNIGSDMVLNRILDTPPPAPTPSEADRKAA